MNTFSKNYQVYGAHDLYQEDTNTNLSFRMIEEMTIKRIKMIVNTNLQKKNFGIRCI